MFNLIRDQIIFRHISERAERRKGKKQRKRQRKLSPEREPRSSRSIDFIQSAMPLIPISSRPLGSRRTIGLITDRDKTRKSGICVREYTRGTFFLFSSLLLQYFFSFLLEITNRTIILYEMRSINTRYSPENRSEIDVKNSDREEREYIVSLSKFKIKSSKGKTYFSTGSF